MITTDMYLEKLQESIRNKLPGHQQFTVYEVTQKPDADNNKRVFHIRRHNQYVGIVIKPKDLENPNIILSIEGTARAIARKFRTGNCTYLTPKREPKED